MNGQSVSIVSCRRLDLDRIDPLAVVMSLIVDSLSKVLQFERSDKNQHSEGEIS